MRRTLAAGLIVFGLGAASRTRRPRTLAAATSRPAPIFAVDRGADDAQPNTQVEPDSFSWGEEARRDVPVVAHLRGREPAGSRGRRRPTAARTGAPGRSRSPSTRRPPIPSSRSTPRTTWLITGLGFVGRFHEVCVSRSPDGLRWSQPVVAAADTDEDRDKEWIGCDNGTRSPYRGPLLPRVRRHDALAARRPDERRRRPDVVGPQRLQPGVTGPGAVFSGPMPVTRPNGDLVIPYTFFAPINQGGRGAAQEDRIAAVVSHDGGATFTQPIRIAALEASDDLEEVRAPALPSAAVDAAGKIYVAWMDCRFREAGDANDVVFSTSANATQWCEPTRLPLSRAVDVHLAGDRRRPGDVRARRRSSRSPYYSLRMRSGCKVYVPGCYQQIDSWLVQSKNAGVTWASRAC